MPIEYPVDFKRKIIRRYEKGESIKELSQEFHIAQSTIYHWRKLFCSIQTPQHTYTPKEFDVLSRKLEKMEHEVEIIRLSDFLPKCRSAGNLKYWKRHTVKINSSVYMSYAKPWGCRGTFYNHIFRRVDRSKREEEQAELMLRVQQIFDDSQQRFGAEKIRTILAQNGMKVSAKRISAIMQELDLRSIRSDAKKQYKKRQQYAKRNLLEREFVAERPNQIWVSDITYFRVNNYWVYLCIILDLYARRIVGYRVSRNASTNLVTATFRNAYQERGKPTNLTFHSDRGKQYTSAAFTLLLQKNGVKQSFSATGRPHDNAVAETFLQHSKKKRHTAESIPQSKAFSKALSNTFNSIMKFVRTKHSNTRRRRPLKRSTMPVLSKMGVQIASWNENNTFSFRDF